MKSGLLVFLFLTLALVSAGGRGRADARPDMVARQCPKVTVNCPELVTSPGLPALFSAAVEGAAPGARLTFTWTASAGSLASGQGTPNLTVDTTGLPGNMGVTASVEVGGLPEGCANKDACTTAVLRPFDPHPLDEYGKIPFAHEQARLDNFVITLHDLPEAQGYMVCYGGRRGRRGEAMARCARAKKYLVGKRGLAPQRLTLIDGGYREELTVVLWVLPPDFPPPPPFPTVAPGDAEFVPEPRAKSRTRRRARRR